MRKLRPLFTRPGPARSPAAALGLMSPPAGHLRVPQALIFR